MLPGMLAAVAANWEIKASSHRNERTHNESTWDVCTIVREAPVDQSGCSNGILPNSFEFGNGYFDNDYGQTLFLDGILMDISW